MYHLTIINVFNTSFRLLNIKLFTISKTKADDREIFIYICLNKFSV